MIYRDSKRLPRLPIPFNCSAVADPYRIVAEDDVNFLLLGNKPIMSVGRQSTRVAILVRTSYWLKVSVEELEQAYRDPDGECWSHWAMRCKSTALLENGWE